MSDSFRVVLLRTVTKRIPVVLYRCKPRPRRPYAKKGREYWAYEKNGKVYVWIRRGVIVELPEGSFERVEQKKRPPEEAPN